jgi:ribosomal 50S subunit-recycling heat shock protein
VKELLLELSLLEFTPRRKGGKDAKYFMRLDLFLKASRLCLRRTIAQKLCDTGRVEVNGKLAKPAHSVSPGDEITIHRGSHIKKVRVNSLPEARQTSRHEAHNLFEIVDEQIVEPD